MKSTATVIYLNKPLYQKVKQAANQKFDKPSYVKSLWITREYKKRGGKVRYEGGKPSNESIKKAVASAGIQQEGCFVTASLLWNDYETDEIDFEKALTEDCTDSAIKKVLSYYQSYASELNSVEDLLEETDDAEEDDSEESDADKTQERINEVYSKYHATVNMGYSALKKWSENPCSRAASLSRAPIARNMRLLSKSKDQWTMADVRSANRTISFVSRMKGAEQGEKVKGPGGESCPSKRDISLKNWAFSP
jgi:hypothetical protein